MRTLPTGSVDPNIGRRVLFFLNVTTTPDIYTLSLHDALPISLQDDRRQRPDLQLPRAQRGDRGSWRSDRKSTRLNSSHVSISYAVFCLKKKSKQSPPVK